MGKIFEPEMIRRIEYLSEPVVSPDGERVAYVKNIVKDEENRFFSKVFVMDKNGKNIQEVKMKNGQQKAPWFSPDGKYISFLSDESGTFQVWIKDLSNDTFRKITSVRHGIENYSWSPCCDKIVFQGKFYKDEIKENLAFCEMTVEEYDSYVEEKKNAPIEITDIIYKFDGEGISDGSMPLVGIAQLDSLKQSVLVEKFPCIKPSWSPDGEKITFYGRPYEGVKARKHELFVCDETGEGLNRLSNDMLIIAEQPPCFTKDSKYVIFDAWPSLPNGGEVQSLFKVSVEGGKSEEIFDSESEKYYGVGGYPISRTFYGSESPKYYTSADGKNIYYLLAWHAKCGIFKINMESKKIEPVLYGDFTVQNFSLGKNDELVYTKSSPKQIAEVYYKYEKLTDSNEWMKDYNICDVRKMRIKTSDGQAEIDGWVMEPRGIKAGEKYPAVLDIRGGPETTSSADFWHEYQALANAGFAVIYCNPRGSMGYGPKFTENGAAWSKAQDDIICFVDAAVNLGFIDESRIGVTGGSYGASMTTKLISTTDKFAAAVVQRVWCNGVTSYGTGDIGFASSSGPVSSDFKMQKYFLDRVKISSITEVENIKVPVLLLHGYNDYRCSFEQSEQFFVAMKERNPKVPIRLVMFPEEDHGITRNGKPNSQVSHLEEMVEWFKKHLIGDLKKGGENE